MAGKNRVYIATSIDGYIADNKGKIDWLDTIPNTDSIDMGYNAFMENTDALVMGKNTFKTVLGFGIEWPYEKPVFVVSTAPMDIPKDLNNKVFNVTGSVHEILEHIHQQGFHNLYIDGGITIQNFLKHDLIDEMIITIIPVLLGGGIPLFSAMDNRLNFKCTHSKLFLGSIAQNHFVRKD